MISTFAIIINDKIEYVTEKDNEPIFEVGVFANALIKKLSNNKWRIHKIILKPINTPDHDKLLIRQIVIPEHNLDFLYCIKGNFKDGSKIGYEILEKFQKKIETEFNYSKLSEILKEKKIVFEQYCDEVSYCLEQEYGQLIENEPNLHEKFTGDPALLYSGVSCQGLPIVSKLFAVNLIDNEQKLDETELKKRIEFFETTISGQLATISINSFIRARSYVEEIQIKLDPSNGHFGFINFAQVGMNDLYTLELFTMGQPSKSNEFLNKVKNTSNSNFACLQKPFAGELKPYADLSNFLNKLDFN